MNYAKAVLDLLKDAPKRRQWLVNQLCPLVMSEKKLDKTLKELTDERKIVKDSRKPESRGGWETWYTMPNHRYLLEVDAARIIGAIERLKPLLLRMPTVDEIAREVGITPKDAEPLVYKLTSETGWYNPTQQLIEDARVRLGETLICAARIKDHLVDENGESERFDYDKEPEDATILDNAKHFLKEKPTLLPSLSKDGEQVVAWPSGAMGLLGDNYVAKDRIKPFFAVIDRGTGKRIF